METFLDIVSKDIINKYGNKLSNIAIVFPNKRASLFMSEAIAKANKGKALWKSASSSTTKPI